MKDHEATREGVQPQQSAVADLLRDRLAAKLTEDELTSLISEVGVLTHKKSPEEQRPQLGEAGEERVKNTLDYIETKCWAIERALRSADRHMRRGPREREERVRDRSRSPLRFRERSPLRGIVFGEGLMYGGLNPVTSTLTSTITTTRAGANSRNPWLDSYFS